MKTITLDLYSFEELSEEAKQTALAHYRDFNLDDEWWDFVYDDFVTLCSYLAIVVDKAAIKFEGFYSQGDGSGFNADVDVIRLRDAILAKAWQNYAPTETFEFPVPNIDHRVMKLIEKGGIQLDAKILARRQVYGVIADLGGYPSNGPRFHDYIYGEIDALEEWLKIIATQLNKFLYKALEMEYDYRTSDEAIAEALNANEIPFTSDGRSALAIEKLTKNNN